MGPSHLRLLTVFGEQLIMGASWQLVHLRMMVGPLSFPLHGLMTSRYRGESAVCLSSGRGGMRASHQIISYQITCHASPAFPRFRVNGSLCSNGGQTPGYGRSRSRSLSIAPKKNT